MACVTLATLALTATLFGSQQLHVEKIKSAAPKNCENSHAATDRQGTDTRTNATLTLKNAAGKSVYETKVQVQRFQFFESTETGDYKGGVAPATSATFIVKYPVTKETSTAVTADLKTVDETFHESAQLSPFPKNVTPQKVSPLLQQPLMLGLK